MNQGKNTFLYLPSWLLLRGGKRRTASLSWNQNTALLFKPSAHRNNESSRDQKGGKRVQLRLCLICDKPYCENQTTWNFKAELEIGDREWSWDGKNTPGEWNGLKVTGEGGGTVINGEWQKKLQIIMAKLESPKRIKTEARFLENTWSN